MFRLALLSALAWALSTPLVAQDLTVFAAASLRDALTEVAEAYEATSEQSVTLSLAGSGALARQIGQGAPADVFLSANVAWMDMLEEAGALDTGSRTDLLSNGLVLIAPAPSDPISLDLPAIEALLGPNGYLAMGLTAAVPAGIYGKAALTSLGLWDPLARRVAQADNVRAALALVATGEAPLGIVYATDAQAEEGVDVVATFPETSHPPIIYPAASVARSDHPAKADFLGFLASDRAQDIFARHGFLPAKATP